MWPRPPAIVAKTDASKLSVALHGVPLKAAAIQFPLLHPLVASVLCGAVGTAQARENAGLIESPIDKGISGVSFGVKD